jgi:hypothetical protein
LRVVVGYSWRDVVDDWSIILLHCKGTMSLVGAFKKSWFWEDSFGPNRNREGHDWVTIEGGSWDSLEPALHRWDSISERSKLRMRVEDVLFSKRWSNEGNIFFLVIQLDDVLVWSKVQALGFHEDMSTSSE